MLFNKIKMENCSSLNAEMDISDINFDSSFELENRPGTPPELVEIAERASTRMLPERSSKRYMQVYDCFMKWKNEKKATSNSERVLLSYFTELVEVKELAGSSVWSIYSMLKATLKAKTRIDISTYVSLTQYVKAVTKNHVPKEAKEFEAEQVQRFLDAPPDDLWLDVKVISFL